MRAQQVFENFFGQPDFGNAVAQQNQMALRIHLHFLHVQGAAYASSHLLEFLNRGRLRKWNYHGYIGVEFGALLWAVVGHEDQAFADGRKERIRGGLEREQRLAPGCRMSVETG